METNLPMTFSTMMVTSVDQLVTSPKMLPGKGPPCWSTQSKCPVAEPSDSSLTLSPNTVLAEQGARFLEPGAQRADGALLAGAADALDRDRETGGRTAEWKHERRLASEVDPDGEGREGEDAAPVLVHVFQHHVDPAELGRQRAEARRQEHVVALVESRHLPAELVRGLRRAHVVGGRDLLALLRRAPSDVLDLALARRTPRR